MLRKLVSVHGAKHWSTVAQGIPALSKSVLEIDVEKEQTSLYGMLPGGSLLCRLASYGQVGQRPPLAHVELDRACHDRRRPTQPGYSPPASLPNLDLPLECGRR